MSDARQAEAANPEASTHTSSEFLKLVENAIRPTTDPAKQAIERSVRTLAELALENVSLVQDDALTTIDALVAALDEKLTAQLNEVIHHPEYQELESAWRGLHYLVKNTETDERLKIKYLNVNKNELRKTLKTFKGTNWDQSPFFKAIYTQEYGQLGGQPYACLIGDYYFDHTPADMELLGEIAKTAAAAHAPFLAAASPTLLQMQSWTELPNPRDLTKIFQTPGYDDWRALRAHPDSKYIGLTAPRFLGRRPYGAKTDPVEEFDFEEHVSGAEHDKYCWNNAAYAMAVNINQAFKKYGWCAQIRGYETGGIVKGLPTHTFPTDDGGVDMKCPTEVAISYRREPELEKNGIIALVHEKNESSAVFMGAPSLHQPVAYEDEDATASAKLGAKLPYMFATCRFAHYLNFMVHRKVGSSMELDEVRTWLNNWIGQYVLQPGPNQTEAMKARQPLSAAEVVVTENKENRGEYDAKFYLRPHYQLEKLKVSLSLVSKLPSTKS